MSGGVALIVAVYDADRGAIVTFVSMTTGDESLPPPTDALRAQVPAREPDPDDRVDAVDLLVASVRASARSWATMPGSTLVVLPGSGHEVLERSWPAFADALVAHTARGAG